MKKADKISFSMRKVADLIPYARNARTHSTEQVAKIASSIKEFGFLNPVIISEDGGFLAGHGRVMADQKLGLKEIPCIAENHLTEAQKRAYILADNRLSLDAGWDEEMLRIEIQHLSNESFDLSLTGFSDDEIKRFAAQIDEDIQSVITDDSKGFQFKRQNILESTDDEQTLNEDEDFITEIPKQKAEGQQSYVNKLYFNRLMIPLTEDESAIFKSKLDEHVELFGSPYGFIRSILG